MTSLDFRTTLWWIAPEIPAQDTGHLQARIRTKP